MATGNSVAPVIIKKKKVVAGGGHHGGAWKVAYADFVTAMMAFFMLMWLLNATTEKQRKGIADYFNPTVPINRISGGGEGAFGGDSIFSENTLARNGTGSSGRQPPWLVARDSADSQGGTRAATEFLDKLNATLIGSGGESELMENALKHVVSRLSDEGAVIEVFDRPGSPLFTEDHRATELLNALLAKIANIAASSDSELAITSHARTEPVVRANVDLWDTTMARSLEINHRLLFSGVAAKRISRLTGQADTEPVDSDPLSARNNRVEITFLIDGL